MTRKRMFNRIRLILFCILTAAAADSEPLSSIDRIRAVVNGRIITQGDIDIRLSSTNTKDKPRQEQYLLGQLVNGMLIRDKASEMGLELPRTELEKQAERIKGNYPGVPLTVLVKWIEDEELRRAIRRILITPRVIISPDDIRDYYTKHPELFNEPAKVLIRGIAVKYYPEMQISSGIDDIKMALNALVPRITDTDAAAAIKALNEKLVNAQEAGNKMNLLGEVVTRLEGFTRSPDAILAAEATPLFDKYRYFKTRERAEQICTEILERLAKGEDFDALVIRYSEGAYRANGGKWNWFGIDGLSAKLKPIEDAAFALEAQQTSGMLDADNTMYIIQKIGSKEASSQEISAPEVQELITTRITEQREREQEQKLLDELKDAAYIEFFK